MIITTMKLKAQLALVDRALAGARMRRGTISAGYLELTLAGIRGKVWDE